MPNNRVKFFINSMCLVAGKCFEQFENFIGSCPQGAMIPPKLVYLLEVEKPDRNFNIPDTVPSPVFSFL